MGVNVSDRAIKTIGFNTQGLKSNISFIEHLMKDYGIIFICEHWLSSHKLYFTPAEKNVCGRPFLGNCFLIDHGIAPYTEVIHEDPHILAIKITSTATPLLVVGVYLTSYRLTKSVEEYNEQLNLLTSILLMNVD